MSNRMSDLKNVLQDKITKVENVFNLSEFLSTDFSDSDFHIERHTIDEKDVPEEFRALATEFEKK